MKHTKIIKTKHDDEVSITIECEGFEPITFTVTHTSEGKRFANVQCENGGCGTVADSQSKRKTAEIHEADPSDDQFYSEQGHLTALELAGFFNQGND